MAPSAAAGPQLEPLCWRYSVLNWHHPPAPKVNWREIPIALIDLGIELAFLNEKKTGELRPSFS